MRGRRRGTTRGRRRSGQFEAKAAQAAESRSCSTWTVTHGLLCPVQMMHHLNRMRISYDITCMFHVQTQSSVLIHLLHPTDECPAPYLCLPCFPFSSAVAAGASLFATFCSSRSWQHEVGEKFYSLSLSPPPFENQRSLVFSSSSALPAPAAFVFHGVSFRWGSFYCVLVCFFFFSFSFFYGYLQCCATFPVFNSLFKCLQAELLCIVYVLSNFYLFPPLREMLIVVFVYVNSN